MRFSNTLAFLALTAFSAVKAQEVESEDIESPCQSVCSRVVDISAQCDTDDDERELNCICGADGAREQIPLCEACIASVGDEDGDDVGDLRRSCDFSSTTYTSGATVATSGPSSNVAQTTSAPNDSAATPSSSTTQESDLAAGPAASVPDDGDTATDNIAAATAMPMVGAGAGVILAAIGML